MEKSSRNRILTVIVLCSTAVLLFCIGRLAWYSISTYRTEKNTDTLRAMIGESLVELTVDPVTGMVITTGGDGSSYGGSFSAERPGRTNYPDSMRKGQSGDAAGDTDMSTPADTGGSDGASSAGTDASGGTDPSDGSTPADTGASGADTLPEVMRKYEYIYGINHDTVGWISIDDTRIDYPVMQNIVDDTYYLSRDFFKDKDASGVPFLDGRCSTVLPSTNLIIYGHNMKNGTKFADLLKYENRSFYDEHRYFRFDTIYEEAVYEIIAVFRSRVAYEDEDVFKFYQFIDAGSGKDFEEYIMNIKALSIYDIEATAVYTDQLVTLTTCEYSVADGRFVVVGRRIK